MAIKRTLPQVTYQGGKLLERVAVFSVFWGAIWMEKQYQALSEEINTFLSYITASELIDQLKEYDTSNFTIRHGKLTGTKVLNESLEKEIDNKIIKERFATQIKNYEAMTPTPNTLFMLFFPPGVTITLGKKKSCDYFCGFHDAIDKKIVYSVIPYVDCQLCRNNLSLLDAYTLIISHELCEAITDPIPKKGWYSSKDNEIGDICVGQQKKIGKYLVQREWSNKHKSCL